MPSVARHKGAALSGGERQMLAVGRALLAGPRVLMLDEPSAGLAPRLISDLLSRIRLLVDRGLPVLLVEQNVKAALKVVDHLYLLERGRIVGKGPADVMAADQRIVEAYLGHDRRRSGFVNIAQQIINGIVLGSGYACIALGWTILLGVARLVNFAHGQLYMLGAFIAWYAITRLGLSYPLAIVVAAVFLALLGALMQSAMMRLVMTQNLTSLMIVTLGLGYVIQGGSALIFGGNPHTFPGTLARAKIEIGPLWFTWQDVLVLVVTLAFTARCGCSPSGRATVRSFARSRRIPSSRNCSASMRRSSISWSSCSNARRWRSAQPWWRLAHRS